MVKKILFAAVGGAVALLVLGFALILLLSYREFFGPAITWVLIACVAALAAFIVYLVVRYVLETVRKRGSDEEELSEHHIKEMLLSGEPREKGVVRDGAVELSADEPAPASTLENLFAAPTPAAEAGPEVRRASQRTGELRRIEEEHRARLAEAEARARQAAQAEQAARERAAAEARHPAGTGEVLRRTAEQPAPRQQPAPMDETTKSQEVKSVRRQAEAAAAARRRAAEMAARSQSFPAIRPDTLAAIGQQNEAGTGGDLFAEAAGSKIRYANEPMPYEASGEDSVWDRMEVRRSAAPLLTQNERRQGRTGDTALEDITGDFAPIGYTKEVRMREEARTPPAPPRQRTGSIRLEAVEEAVSGREQDGDAGWSYSPAKPPRAWNTADAARRIPGDMPVAPDSPDARAEAAAERKAAAKAPAAAPRARTDAEKAKEAAAIAGEKAAAARAATGKPDARKPAAASTAAAEAPKTLYRKTGAKATAAGMETPARRPATAPPAAAPPATAPGEDPVKRPRGRPPKPKTEEELNAPKRPRGRPPKPKTEEELNAPKRPRGRPPKPKTEEELNAPKRPRGRPRKNPLPEEGGQPAAGAAGTADSQTGAGTS